MAGGEERREGRARKGKEKGKKINIKNRPAKKVREKEEVLAVLVGKDSDGIILEDDSMERNIRGKTCTLGPGGDDGADGHQGAPRAKRARTAARRRTPPQRTRKG